MTTTDRDIRDQVLETIADNVQDYDVDAIVQDLIAVYDLTGEHPRDTVDGIDSTDYWAAVARRKKPEVTRETMLKQVRVASMHHAGYDVPAIVDDIISIYGLRDVRDIPAGGRDGYHDILERHDRDLPAEERVFPPDAPEIRSSGALERLQARLATRQSGAADD